MHDEPGDRQQAAEGRRLPHEVLAQVLSSLRASDVGRSASVCSEWRSAADQETVAWSTAAAELDPFGAIGPDGVAEMLEWAGGSWLRLARTLASPAPRAFKQGVFSSFLFNPALRPASQPSVPPPVLVVASGASGARARDAIALRTAVSEAPPWATIRISGVFHLGELPLTIRKPLRITGVGVSARLVSIERCTVNVACELSLLEHVTVQNKAIWIDSEMCECPPCDNCGGQCSCTCNSDFEERACPAVLVAMGARLIAQHVRVNNHNGTGVQVRPGGAAFLRACTLGYKAPKRTSDRSNMFKTDIGVQALTGSTLAMYDCKVEHATWGVSAGAGATVLAQYNTFAKITRGSLLPAHLFAPGSFGHGDASADAAAASAPSVVVQPWRDGWARGAPASPASPLCSVSV